MKLQSNYQLQTFLAVATQQKSEMTSYFNSGYDVINCCAKFEKFLPHIIIIPSFMSVGNQMPELDRGELSPPYKIGSQCPSYKLVLTFWGVRVCDKVAISAYILKTVEKESFLRLQMRAKEDFNRHQLFPQSNT